MGERGLGMAVRRVAEVGPPGLAMSPVEQGEVLSRVGDHAAAGVMRVDPAVRGDRVPGLDIAALGTVAVQQQPRRLERHRARLARAGHQPVGDAAQRELEAEVVVLRLPPAENRAEHRAPGAGRVEEHRVAGQLQRQPELAGMEADDPVEGRAVDPAVRGRPDLGVSQADHRQPLTAPIAVEMIVAGIVIASEL